MNVKCKNCNAETTATADSPANEKVLLEASGWTQDGNGDWTGCAAQLARGAGCTSPDAPAMPEPPVVTITRKKKYAGKEV